MQSNFIIREDQKTSPTAGIQKQMLGHDSQLMMLKMDFPTGAIGEVHQHEHTQATYVLAGIFEFTIDGQKQKLQAGDACFMPSQVMHGCICLEAGSLIDVFTPERKDFLTTPA